VAAGEPFLLGKNPLMLCSCMCELSREQTFYRVDLPSGVDAGRDVIVDVETSYSHSLHPYPSHITQSEHQHVRFIGNVYFYSPYQTHSLTTVVSCTTSLIESYTREKPVAASEKTITYGPYENVEPFKQVMWSCAMICSIMFCSRFSTVTSKYVKCFSWTYKFVTPF